MQHFLSKLKELLSLESSYIIVKAFTKCPYHQNVGRKVARICPRLPLCVVHYKLRLHYIYTSQLYTTCTLRMSRTRGISCHTARCGLRSFRRNSTCHFTSHTRRLRVFTFYVQLDVGRVASDSDDSDVKLKVRPIGTFTHSMERRAIARVARLQLRLLRGQLLIRQNQKPLPRTASWNRNSFCALP